MVDRLKAGLVQAQGRRVGRSSGRRAMLALLVLVVLAAGAQAVRIHDRDGQWALVSSAAPERLTLDGRDYRRGDPDTEVYADWVKRGTTSGGGTIYTLASSTGTPTVLWVRDGDTVWGYGLLGGP